jgi:hypothetical protein
MAKSRTLTVEEISQLGSEQLAQLLLDVAEDDPTLVRSLRIAVASRDGAARKQMTIDPKSSPSA